MTVKDLELRGVILTPKLTFKSAAPLDSPTLALLRAASCDLLPKEPVMLPSGLVPDLNRYTLAWAASYLVGDRQEALSRLWQVRRAWQNETPS